MRKDDGGDLKKGGYLRGLWCLRVSCAVVGGLLSVVLGPGGAVVGLASGLRGCGRRCGLRSGLTWRENREERKTLVKNKRRYI